MSSPPAVPRLGRTGWPGCARSSGSGQCFAKKRGCSRKAGPPVHDDLVNRQFTAEQPDRLWLTDITEHPTAEGKLYLCAIKDACSGRISCSAPTPTSAPCGNGLAGSMGRGLRRQRRLGKLTPIEYETLYTTAALAA